MPEPTFGDVLREAEREGLAPSAVLAAQFPKPPFCDSCSGPFVDAWLSAYGGHWDTCPNRVRTAAAFRPAPDRTTRPIRRRADATAHLTELDG